MVAGGCASGVVLVFGGGGGGVLVGVRGGGGRGGGGGDGDGGVAIDAFVAVVVVVVVVLSLSLAVVISIYCRNEGCLDAPCACLTLARTFSMTPGDPTRRYSHTGTNERVYERY